MYECACTATLLEWDSEKASANLRKHGVDFAGAATVLTGELAPTRNDEDSDEERSVTIGVDALGRSLALAYAWRGETLRSISARKANASERRQCEKRR